MSTVNNLHINPPKKRRVFFSFHYQQDIERVDPIRTSWRYQHETLREASGFFDGSIWENSQRTSDESLKSLIRDGISNTSVTCVLAGQHTYARRWVRYEIARSIIKGNGLLVVQIHKCRNKAGYTSQPGFNPLDYMGTYLTNDNRILLAEQVNGQWVQYGDYTQSVSLPLTWRKPISTAVLPLSTYANRYCYIAHNGPANFAAWVRDAAAFAGN
jgi:hypothetical protein